MQHLTSETIARLVDEPAEAGEALHLASCLVCRRELDEMRTMTRALAGLPDPEPAEGAWRALEGRLRAEGLIRTAAPRRFRMTPPVRVAASVALFLLGGATGAAIWARLSAGRSAPPETVAVRPAPPTVILPPVDAVVSPADGAEAAARAETTQPEPPPPEVSFASTGDGPTRSAPAARRSPAAAAAAAELARAQREYLAALQRYAELAAPTSGADDATRLRALNGLVSTTQAALDLAPADPVINEYHLGAVEMRDALLRQVARQSESTWF